MARFSSGNVTVQDACYLNDADLARLRRKGDQAWDRVRARCLTHTK